MIKQEDYTDDEYNILNNYLSGIKNTGEELEKLIEEIESLDEHVYWLLLEITNLGLVKEIVYMRCWE